MINIAKQKGRNLIYPEEIYWWKRGEEVPDWLSDQAKISGIDPIQGLGILDLNITNTGGYEILNSSGQGVLVRVKSIEDYVCYDIKNKKIFPLRNIQFDILYEKE